MLTVLLHSYVLGFMIMQYDFHDLNTRNTFIFFHVIYLILNDIQICSEFQYNPWPEKQNSKCLLWIGNIYLKFNCWDPACTWIPSDKSSSIISGFSLIMAIERADLPRGSKQLMSNKWYLYLKALTSLATVAQSPLSTSNT